MTPSKLDLGWINRQQKGAQRDMKTALKYARGKCTGGLISSLDRTRHFGLRKKNLDEENITE